MSITFGNTLLSIVATALTYLFGLRIYRKSNQKSWLNPLYTVTLLLFLLLPFLHMDVKSYEKGSKIFSLLLQTGIVSLAIPIYKQFPLIRKNIKKITVGIVSGGMAGIASSVAFAFLLGLKGEVVASLLPKTATLPVALSVSSSLGGTAPLTILFVLISALFSLIVGPHVLDGCNIKSKTARGLAMGISAQALGANRSFQWGEEEGAMGSVGMTTTAILVSVTIPMGMLFIAYL
ncbi:LrgB family protein [Fictibacillus enclensis]|uniref:Murein hydrolase n=1 Tax=Fictibacillus enclensis TaxID=1017270 RepID=A0A0V8J7E2_9BACL|nr:LrgB family protein [Fictibacillus enclensis]KSU83122.1 murein hydrolase [Fictibacillus enclensis]MDM5340044.1 LrgB family protein [Fictibacillus enclensis]WHY71569.1 LrgB family protein [Fictibacillus enclensis]SCC10428.1 Putative effector of murein hydrolase [Fictibacillus enclensis]